MPCFLRWVLASQVCSVRENPSKCILTMCALFGNFIMSMTAEGPGWEPAGGRWYHPNVTLKETKAQRGKG